MTEIKRNQLRRGKVSAGKSGVAKKPGLVGEVSDPQSVLSDSISKNRRANRTEARGAKAGGFPVEKTTTVDGFETEKDLTNNTPLKLDDGRQANEARRRGSAERGQRSNNGASARGQMRGAERSYSNNRSYSHASSREGFKKNGNFSHSPEGKKSTCETSKRSCVLCAGAKSFWAKILGFFGFGCQKSYSNSSKNKGRDADKRSYPNKRRFPKTDGRTQK